MNLAHKISNSNNSKFIELLDHGVNEGVFPGCSLLVKIGKDEFFCGQSGSFTYEPKAQVVQTETVFDIASITILLATVSLYTKFEKLGLLSSDDLVSRYIQSFSVNKKSSIKISNLLNHTSGLPEWAPFYQQLLKDHQNSRLGIMSSSGAKSFVYNEINRSKLKNSVGVKQSYSDLGLIVLGQVIEKIAGTSLDKVAQKLIFTPLGLESTGFVDLGLVRRNKILPIEDLIAPTEYCAWRKRILCGEVHDDNAWAMGGIAPHAGLFSTVKDLGIFAEAILNATKGRDSIFDSNIIDKYLNYPASFANSSWRLGWDSPSKENGLEDIGFSTNARGINSFTGCSLWIDSDRDLSIIFLSNRIHPSRSNKKIMQFRVDLFKHILEAI